MCKSSKERKERESSYSASGQGERGGGIEKRRLVCVSILLGKKRNKLAVRTLLSPGKKS